MEFRKHFSVLSCVRQAEYDSLSTAIQISTNRIRSGRQPKPGPPLQNQGALFLNQGTCSKIRGTCFQTSEVVSKPTGQVLKPGVDIPKLSGLVPKPGDSLL